MITACEDANETCPVFTSNVKTTLFVKFADLLGYNKLDDFILKLIRKPRDSIIEELEFSYKEILTKNTEK